MINRLINLVSEIEHRNHPVCLHMRTGTRRVGKPGILGSDVLSGRPATDSTTLPATVRGTSSHAN